MRSETPKRYVVGITGASGSIYGVRALEILALVKGAEIHLVMSRSAARTMELETDLRREQVEKLATVVHDPA
ncbi:MAG TPA: flavoprotein, partial [Candidatus Eremiobacteraceae bacterium]|nr:flavoprotein [Candidatus Eremiobacteraceae bacterium]